MTTDTNRGEPQVPDEFAALLSGEISDGSNLEQTKLATGMDQEFPYKLLSFVPSFVWKLGDDVPAGAAHLIIPDITKARIYRIVTAVQTTFIPRVPAGFNRLFVNVNSRNLPAPSELQAGIWRHIVSKYLDADNRPKATQTYLVPCISLYEKPEPVIVEMTPTVYNAIISWNEEMDSETEGRTNLRTTAIYVWRITQQKDSEAKKRPGEAKVRSDKSVNIKPLLAEFAGQMPDVAEYAKIRARATEEYFQTTFAAYSLGHKELELPSQNRETEFADLVPSLEPDQLRALFKRFDIKYPERANKMALIDIALNNIDSLFDAVKEIDISNPPF